MVNVNGDRCLFACFRDFQSHNNDVGIKEFIAFALRMFDMLGTKPNYVSHRCRKISSTNPDVKTYRFSTSALSRVQKRINDYDSLGLSFLCADERGMDVPTLLVEMDLDSHSLGYKSIFIEVSESLSSEKIRPNGDWAEFTLRTLDILVDIQYALCTRMSCYKLPSLYFSSIFTNDLSWDEKLNLAVWLENKQNYMVKLRGVYEYNLLGKDHVRSLEDVVLFNKKLISILGERSVLAIGKEKLFISLPTSVEIHMQMIEVLDAHHLLMKPSASAMRMASL